MIINKWKILMFSYSFSHITVIEKGYDNVINENNPNIFIDPLLYILFYPAIYGRVFFLTT
jgi:hypothetical protein